MADSDDLATDVGALFRTSIRPALEPLEAKRRRVLRVRRLLDLGLLLSIVVVLAAFGVESNGWALLPAAAGAALGLVRLDVGADLLRRARRAAVAAVAQPLGVTYDADGSWFSTSGLHQAGVVGFHNRSELEHLVTGRHRGIEYAMVRARLEHVKAERTESESRTTVFTGLLFRIDVPADFEGTVLLARSYGPPSDMLRTQNPTRFEPFSTPFPDFSEFYQVFTDTPEVARRLIGRALADDLIGLALAQEFRDFTAAFVHGKFLLALPTQRKLLSFGRLGRPFIGVEEDLEQIARDLQIAERLIDHLHGRDSGPLIL